VHGRAGILQLEACQVCGDGWLELAYAPCKVVSFKQHFPACTKWF
jgi:hypothetical protein